MDLEQELLKYLLEWILHLPISFIIALFYLIISLTECLLQTAFEKKGKRKTLIGKISSRECYLIDEQFKKCKENFTDENLKELGALTFTFVESERKNQEDIKTIFDKLKFWKKKDSK